MADNFNGNAEEFESRIKTTASIVQEALREIAGRVSGIFEEAAAETSNFSKTLERDITRSINNLARTSGILESNQSKLTAGALKEKEVLKQIEARNDKIKAIKTQIGIAVRSEKITQEQANKLLGEAIDYERELLAELEAQAKKAREINQNLGLTGQLFEGLAKTLQRFGINSQIIDDIRDKLQQAAVTGKVSFKTAFDAIASGAKEALKDPAVKFLVSLKLIQSGFNDIKKAFNIFKEFDATFTTIARSAGFSSEQMIKMTQEAFKSQNPLSQNVFSAQQTAKAIAELNNSLGLTVDLGGATTNEFASMTNAMGLSADEATKIFKLGRLNNLTLKDTNKAIAAGIIAAQKSTGVQVNAKQVFQDIAKLSAGITAKFNQNPEALAKAAAQARALGLSLEQVDKIGESLLNFESSIENELKAELITSKQLNLERARYAALTGDQVTLTREIANQVGSLAEFQNMNVIAQKSLAEAFGLSRDELAETLQKQETFNKLGDVSKKSAAEQLELARKRGISESDSLVMNLKQQAAAEKLAAAFDNIKTLIADLLSGPFGTFVDLMGYVAKTSWAAYTAFGLMAGISLTKLISGVVLLASSLAEAGVFASATTAALTLGASVVIIGAAVAGLVAMMKSSAEDVANSVPKYAKGGIITQPHMGIVGEAGPEAIIPLNSPRANNVFGGNMDITPIVNAISELRNDVKALGSRPSVAYIQGEDAFVKRIGSNAALGSTQMGGTYKLA